MSVHAIGDRANREALDVFESTRDDWAPLGSGIASSTRSALAPEDIERFASIGVGCSVQFSHAPSDRDLAERFWPAQVDGTVRLPVAVGLGARRNGSDAPVEELDRLTGIRAGVLRTLDERPAWRTGAVLTIEETLVAHARQSRLALGRRAAPRQALPAISPISSCSRATRSVPAGRTRDGRSRRDDGRRTLGAQRSALGIVLSKSARGRTHDARCSRSADVLGRGCGGDRRLEVDGGSSSTTCPRARRFTVVRALVRWDQPADARGTVALARDRGHRRAAELPERPPRVEYALTEKGRALLPVVHEMRRFGHNWLGCGVHDT